MMTEEKVEEQPKKATSENDDPAIISDHAFEPRGEWYTLCRHPGCGLAEAAHKETTLTGREHISYYSDDDD